jgi:feruloyl esterase
MVTRRSKNSSSGNPTASLWIVLLAMWVLPSGMFAATPACENLARLILPNTTIRSAESIAAGALKIAPKPFFVPGSPPFVPPGIPPLSELPAVCRVAADIKPTKDSDIKIEVWMPVSGWNGKFLGVGNGGFSGAIWYPRMQQALSLGYATAGSDTGHEGGPGDASFGLGHPDKVVDFGYRAVHEMTLKAKALIEAFYGIGPRHSYWNGCSTGGRQGLMEAQRFPLDYDGIVAGAPVSFHTHVVASGIWIAQAISKTPASYIPQEKYAMMHEAVLKACDGLDGVRDGLLEDPTRCHFDPKVLQCKQADGPNCLTTAQVEAARAIYAGPRNPRTGEQIFPGLEPGSEPGWRDFFAERREPFVASHFKYLVFGNPRWDFRTLNFDSDVALTDKLGSGILNATDPNLKKFVSQGGKLILYHGWSDPGLAPRSTVNYYNSVLAAFGNDRDVEKSIRLFMIPGQYHCAEGLWFFDVIGALQQWVEQGKAADRIIASHFSNPGQSQTETHVADVQISRWSSVFGKVDRTRPLCPYPQAAKYTGHRSTHEAANFVCTEVSK